MCLIVDANVAALVFSPTPNEDFQPVWQALHDNRAVAIYGGKLTEEYQKLASIRKMLLELDRKGVLRKYPDGDVKTATLAFAGGSIRSDDPHILGLAQVSSVRLLCSHDRDLHADFTNPAILQPPGSVYQNPSHRHLIRRHCADVAKPRRGSGRRKRKPKQK